MLIPIQAKTGEKQENNSLGNNEYFPSALACE
jgi:hypothetical protein